MHDYSLICDYIIIEYATDIVSVVHYYSMLTVNSPWQICWSQVPWSPTLWNPWDRCAPMVDEFTIQENEELFVVQENDTNRNCRLELVFQRYDI